MAGLKKKEQVCVFARCDEAFGDKLLDDTVIGRAAWRGQAVLHERVRDRTLVDEYLIAIADAVFRCFGLEPSRSATRTGTGQKSDQFSDEELHEGVGIDRCDTPDLGNRNPFVTNGDGCWPFGLNDLGLLLQRNAEAIPVYEGFSAYRVFRSDGFFINGSLLRCHSHTR